MEQLLHFFSFQDPIIRNVILGTILLSISSSLVGCFTFLRKRSLVGDAVAHAVLPGICVAFILHGEKNLWILMIGAFVAGWLSLIVIDLIANKSKIPEDSAIALVLSVFFGVGTLLLTHIQHNPSLSSNAAGLENFLFGNAIAINQQDLYAFGTIACILLATITILYKEFILVSFDVNFAKTIGFPVRVLELILTTLTVLAVVIGIQSVGVVLMSAMLITPAATARFWTQKLNVFILIATFLGVISSISGSFISYVTPSPTGPWIVMILSLIAIVSFLFAPDRGIISKLMKQNAFKQKVIDENILKALYQLGENEQKSDIQYSIKELLNKRPMDESVLSKGLYRLTKERFLIQENDTWQLTPLGKNKGQRITKIHRLWEVYLTKYVQIAPDHVHEDADSIEHILTPELEKKLEELLEYPSTDPHNTTIPYKK